MYPSSGCRIFLNNKGYVDNYYKGRILLREFNGGMEVTVWNLQRDDAGYYRCSVFQPTGNSIFQDYVIEIVGKDRLSIFCVCFLHVMNGKKNL